VQRAWRSLVSWRPSGAPRIRLGLLLYSHLTEADAIYHIIFNLIEVSAGERYLMDPFYDLYRPQTAHVTSSTHRRRSGSSNG